MKRIPIIIVLICSYFALTANAANKPRPEWLVKGVDVLNAMRSNTTYRFVIVHSSGADLKVLQAERMSTLSTYIGQTYRIQGSEQSKIISSKENGRETLVETYEMEYKTDASSEKFYARQVDEYWEYHSLSGIYDYYVLFAISEQGKTPIFDEFNVTSPNDAASMLMSIVPGVGQFYKGSVAKGAMFMGLTAATAVGIIVCESTRSSYVNKSIEQPKYKKEYSTRADNWETARNICIGVGGAIWFWNIIDAFTTKSKKRKVVISQNNSLSIQPFANPNSAGQGLDMGLALSFNF